MVASAITWTKQASCDVAEASILILHAHCKAHMPSVYATSLSALWPHDQSAAGTVAATLSTTNQTDRKLETSTT